MKEGGERLAVVDAVGKMERKAVEVLPPEPKPKPEPEPSSSERTFPQTGKTVRGKFLRFFDRYGVDFCGYPITEQFKEDGVPTQYFQRIGLEEGKTGQTQLKLVGSEAWTSRRRIAELEAQIADLSQQPPPAGSPAQPPIEDIVDDLILDAVQRYPARSLTDIKQLVIHHTATSPTITPKRIADYQVRTLKKPGIVYHYVIAANGTIYQTNRLETACDHAYGRNNQSVGVCFVGNFTKAIPTNAQLKAGGRLCAWLLAHFRLSTSRVVGLREYVNTGSPGNQWLNGQRWKIKLLAEVEAVLEAAYESQSVLIASLREQIETLEVELRRLKEQRAVVRGSAKVPLQDIVNELTMIIFALQKQIDTLKRENDKLTFVHEERGKEQSELVASLQEQVSSLETDREELLTRLETGLMLRGDDQAELIASLRAQIKNLQAELKRLRELRPTAPPVPQPEPVNVKISRPPIQDMVDRLAKHETKTYRTRSVSKIRELVVHHSAVAPSAGPARIAQYHVKNLDWPGIGYHYVVSDDGIVYETNRLTTVSNQSAGMNTRSVGICFLGNFNKKSPPPAQIQSGAHLLAWLMQELDLDLDAVKGHREHMQTACPGHQWLGGERWKQMLRREITKVQAVAAQSSTAPAVAPETKPLHHYMLFGHNGDTASEKGWQFAQDYIAAFRPTVGFSSQDAAQAEYVTIVGDTSAISEKVEKWLVAHGSLVERITGENEAALQEKLASLVEKGTRFLSSTN
jgi:N-acetyl-anhydromuramyl-L-alanine amidase AmpD